MLQLEQQDFFSLAVVELPCCEGSLDSKYKERVFEKEVQVPVSFVSEEVHAMISDWDILAAVEHTQAEDSTSSNVNRMSFEPLRQMPTLAPSAPPSKFQRRHPRKSALDATVPRQIDQRLYQQP